MPRAEITSYKPTSQYLCSRLARITNGMVRRFYVASDLCMRGLRRRRPMELHTIGIGNYSIYRMVS